MLRMNTLTKNMHFLVLHLLTLGQYFTKVKYLEVTPESLVGYDYSDYFHIHVHYSDTTGEVCYEDESDYHVIATEDGYFIFSAIRRRKVPAIAVVVFVLVAVILGIAIYTILLAGNNHPSFAPTY